MIIAGVCVAAIVVLVGAYVCKGSTLASVVGVDEFSARSGVLLVVSVSVVRGEMVRGRGRCGSVARC
jgi:hypothetical protein